MSVPEGYAVAPTTTDHLLKLAIPIPGRDKPVLVEMPRREWMPPAEVKKYREWITPFGEAEMKVVEWGNSFGKPESERPPRPTEAEKVLEDFDQREVTLRWLKPHVSATDYRALLEKLPDGTVEWIKEQILPAGISTGGIFGLHRLLEEHGEAVEYDLIERGLRLRDLGKPWFSWTDLRALEKRARTDWTMELFRSRNPETWLWADPKTMLFAEVATTASDLRYFAAFNLGWPDGEVPERYWPSRYGPPRNEPVQAASDDSEDIDTARQVAASMRG
ncbi:tail assembly chaperone [Gordonia phage Ecliptus]|nr:tail assembly chaperone [Gordonia phage Ecliptus]